MTAVFICQHCTGHLFGHAPGCPVSKAMIEWRVAALAARPVSDSGLTRRLAERIHGNESHPRPSFAECPYEPCVEARAALASTPEPDLDVERLAEALAIVYGDGSGTPLTDHTYGAAALLARLSESKP